MDINKTDLQVQMDESFTFVTDFAAALRFSETYKLQSGITDWAQASASYAI